MSNIQTRITSETGTGITVVPLADMKTYMRVDYTTHDDIITDEISAAVKMVEEWCSISLLVKSVEIINTGPIDLWLPYGPVDSSSITLVDESSTAIVPTIYGDEFPRVIYAGGAAGHDYTLTYDTTAHSHDASIKSAIKKIVYASYERQGFTTNRVVDPTLLDNEAFQQLQPYNKQWF